MTLHAVIEPRQSSTYSKPLRFRIEAMMMALWPLPQNMVMGRSPGMLSILDANRRGLYERHLEACPVSSRLDELLRNIALLSTDTGDRSLAAKTSAHVLLEAVAQCTHEGQESAQARYFKVACHPDGHKP